MTCRVPAASLDLMQASDKVSPPLLSKAMTGLATHPTVAAAMLREQLGGKKDAWFQETCTEGIGFEKFINQEGKESQASLNGDEVLAETVVRGVAAEVGLLDPERSWRRWRWAADHTHYKCHFLARSRKTMLNMVKEATEAIVEHGLECWCQDEETQTFRIEHKDKEYLVTHLSELKVMGSLQTREADIMSAMKFRMNTADKALRSAVTHRIQEQYCHADASCLVARQA